jgi:hypothetical protein
LFRQVAEFFSNPACGALLVGVGVTECRASRNRGKHLPPEAHQVAKVIRGMFLSVRSMENSHCRRRF